MTLPISSSDPTFRIYLALSQYPILQSRIRVKMQQELVRRGVISQKEFENQVREQAIISQGREGLNDPFGEEPEDVWRDRLGRVRDYLTDLFFANNLPFELFEEIVRDTLAEQGAESDELLASFNPELAPQELLFEQALAILNLPPEERRRYEARLQEIKVVLIRTMISDQLAYINIAKQWLSIAELLKIRKGKIGKGKIGGKAAGMLLAQSILTAEGDEEIKASLNIPESYFLGADVMYTYMAYNDLMDWADQKYKDAEDIRADYPLIQVEYLAGEFPPDILEEIRNLLERVGNQPLIVRSSSLLEDNFGTSFAGKYDSFFCPNQATPKENLQNLCKAIASVYASALSADALLYRRANGLQDYDERIAVLIQIVQGEKQGRYFMPHAAGVAFSQNLYRWSPQIRREDGFLRVVWGLGTRAVDRVGNDYPRLVALSHPLLRAESSPKDIHRYSQHFVDLIDLEDNEFKTMPVGEVLDTTSPILRYMVQLYEDDFLAPLRSRVSREKVDKLVVTLDELLARTRMAEVMRRMLNILEVHYQQPVDMEFTVRVREPRTVSPEVDIFLLQCRPQSHLQESNIRLPKNLEKSDIIFSTSRMVPHGQIQAVRYVLFVSPEGYYALPTPEARNELGRAISRLNDKLKGHNFICVGPGRWGTSNPDLGVHIGYSDIYNTRALVEISGDGVGTAPELSFGTHFFQDLLESQIFPLAVYLDDEDAIFNRDFFYNTPNVLAALQPKDASLSDHLHVIDVNDFRPGYQMDLVMDDEASRAVLFLVPEIEEQPEKKEMRE
ncbi:MAG: PEP/pyruvate-binding domain-containing protein [Anaerolineae bacterium]|nr:PEP/pyruvate-binding domain-containing protein [Anaerolineae bacterium]